MIAIDAEKGTIDVEVSADELAKRKAGWKPRKTIYTSGVLHKYAREVGPARHGAVTHPGGKGEGHVYADI
jgi:dihydroxy-acid dehydratase